MGSRARLAFLLLALVLPTAIIAAPGGGAGGGGGASAGSGAADYESLPGKDVARDVRNNLVSKDIADKLPDGFLDGPKSGDLTYRMLKRLLGEPAVQALAYYDQKDSSVGGITAVTMVLGVMPFIAILMSGVYLVYVFFAGLFATTATGQLLGRRWDTWVVPTRTAVSYTMLVPVPPLAPLSSIQIIVLGLALFGIGGASALFKHAASALVSTPLIVIENREAPEFVHAIVRSAICVADRVANGEKPKDAVTVVPKKNSRQSGRNRGSRGSGAGSETVGWRYEFGKEGYCGKIDVTRPKPSGSTLLHDKINYALRARIFNAVYSDNGGLVLTTFQNALQRIAFPMVQQKEKRAFTKESLAAEYHRLVQSVQSGLHRAATRARDEASRANRSELVNTMTRFGFAAAGTVYWTLSRRQAALMEAIDSALSPPTKPGSSPLTFLKSLFVNDPISSRTVSALYDLNDEAFEKYKITYRPREGLDDAMDSLRSEGTVMRWLSDASSAAAASITDVVRLVTDSSRENPDPMLEIKTLGHGIQNAMAALMGGGWLASKVTPGSKLAERLRNAGEKSGIQIKLAGLLGTAGMLIGFLYSNIIPAMPYIMWMMAMTGLMIFYAEALVASPFWMARHTDPEGDGFVGRAGSGYSIVLVLILYPVLMVVGLVIGMSMVRIMGWFVNITLWPFLQDMNDGGVNITSFFGGLLLFGVAYLLIVYKSFSLTYALPQAILRWMGVSAHFSDMGEEEARNKLLTVTQSATSQAQMLMSPGKMLK